MPRCGNAARRAAGRTYSPLPVPVGFGAGPARCREEGAMRVLPWGARALIVCAVLAACGCVAPALTDAGTPWPAVALLCVLCLGCELLKSCRLLGSRVPEGMGAFFPVVLAAVFLLPPAA